MQQHRPVHRAVAVALALCALLVVAAPAPVAAIEESPGNLVGIDVSHWQGKIIWRDVRAAGVDFAFAKATEGQGYVDPQYARNRKRAGANGIAFSAYHFARPDRTTKDAVREADHFIRTAALTSRHLL
ncbi:MAG TPA: glycoside hydrolase family 25 protein, partial [Candidatus Limnocylindrales bacterium]